jgi:hypothetical protein
LKLFPFADCFAVGIVVNSAISIRRPIIGGGAGIVESVANSTYDFLGLALYLLCCTFCLGLGVAGPLADLTFYSTRRIIDGSFNFVVIHKSTSVGKTNRCATEGLHLRTGLFNETEFDQVILIGRSELESGSSSSYELDNQNDKGEHQQNMDKSTHCVTAN